MMNKSGQGSIEDTLTYKLHFKNRAGFPFRYFMHIIIAEYQ